MDAETHHKPHLHTKADGHGHPEADDVHHHQPDRGAPTTAAPSPTPTPAATCSTVAGNPVNVGGPGIGAVTVTITVCNGTLTKASSVLSQSDLSLNSQALPAMDVLAVQYYKTNITAIHYSGATYTSAAYQASLQSALTKAGI